MTPEWNPVDGQAALGETAPAEPPPGAGAEGVESEHEGRLRGSNIQARVALGAYVAYLMVAFPLLLFKFGAYRWFLGDDWDFLVTRRATNLGDLLRPHNQVQWSTLPILVYRALFAVVGLHSYKPYEACSILLHLGVAALLWMIMRRAGVTPWIATAAGAVFVLFGPGEQDIIWAFQIGYVGSELFGLVQLILADHDGPIDRRDWFGLLAGAAGLMCSSVSVSMVVVVGIFTMLRRGWRAALFQTVPLGILYVVWAKAEHVPATGPFGNPTASVVVDWITSAQSGTFLALGHFPVVAALLGVMLVVGLAVAWVPLDWSTFRRRAAVPTALLVGSVIFAITSCFGRWWAGPDAARVGRYLHIFAVCTLPALAVAADALVRRWRVLTPIVIGLLVIAIPFNLNFTQGFPFVPDYYQHEKQLILGIARAPDFDTAPASIHPEPVLAKPVTVGWLRAAKRAGKVGDAGPIPVGLESEFAIILGVVQTDQPISRAHCTVESGVVQLSLPEGSVIGIDDGDVDIWTLIPEGQTVPAWVQFSPERGHRLTIVRSGLRLNLLRRDGLPSFTLCR